MRWGAAYYIITVVDPLPGCKEHAILAKKYPGEDVNIRNNL